MDARTSQTSRGRRKGGLCTQHNTDVIAHSQKVGDIPAPICIFCVYRSRDPMNYAADGKTFTGVMKVACGTRGDKSHNIRA